jgi:HK97 family phage prohead protease
MKNKRETLAVAFALQDSNMEENTFRGMASVFNNLIDTFVPTRILPGSFSKTLAESQRRRVKILLQHNSDWPIGLPTLMEEDPDGLLVEGKISQTTMGKDTLILARDGVLNELSIGFDPINHTMVEEDGPEGLKVNVRHITEIRLWEFSFVTWGANNQAKVTSINSLANAVRSYGPDLELSKGTDLYLRNLFAKFRECDEVEPESLFQIATQLIHELHQGKVLSGKNLTIVTQARDALQKLIDTAEPPQKNGALTEETRERMRSLDLMELDLMGRA